MTSPAAASPFAPLLVNTLSTTALPENWKYIVLGVVGNGSGFSKPVRPLLGLPVIVLPSIRSAYVPISTKPLPHGTSAAVEFAGAVKLSFDATTLFRKIVQRWRSVV